MYTSPHGQGLVNQPPTPRPTSAWSLLLEAQHFVPYPRTLVYTSGSQKRGLGMTPLQDIYEVALSSQPRGAVCLSQSNFLTSVP